MPIIKLMGYSKDNPKAEEIRHKIDEAMGPLFGQGNAGTVSIPSDCRTCDSMPEPYEYLEIIITEPSNKEKIIPALQELHLGLDVIFIQHIGDGYIPADEMV
jgi:hypothetical protein